MFFVPFVRRTTLFKNFCSCVACLQPLIGVMSKQSEKQDKTLEAIWEILEGFFSIFCGLAAQHCSFLSF
jgi:hypothetical protein